MEYTIRLCAEEFIGFPCFIRAGANTKLLFVSDEYPLDELQVTITNGDMLIRRTIKDGMLDLTQYTTKACVVEIVVDLVLKGCEAKTWRLEPFVVRENGGGYVLIPEIALLRKEVRRMKKIIKELDTKINDTM